MQQNRPRIGIITGSGPRAGIDLWEKILDANRAQLGFEDDLNAPHIVVLSVPELGLSMDIESNREFLEKALTDACQQISKQCDLFCIACNTLHYFADHIAKLDIDAKFVSIVEAVCDSLIDMQVDQVALLGTQQIMDIHGKWSAYKPLLDVVPNIEALEPKDSKSIHNLIRMIKKGAAKENLNQWHDILCKINSPYTLLACTELPLIANVSSQFNYETESDSMKDYDAWKKAKKNTQLLDANQILAEHLVKMTLLQE